MPATVAHDSVPDSCISSSGFKFCRDWGVIFPCLMVCQIIGTLPLGGKTLGIFKKKQESFVPVTFAHGNV